MKVFRTDYAAVGIYLGGVNSACAYGNLSAAWVKSVAAMGYGMLPTYVGQQAPCWNGKGALINPKGAVAQANSDAANAIAEAKHFGLPAGSPIYYDMEAYAGNASCTAAVLTFLSAWDHQVAAGGYVSGVYSSQDSGITDMQHAVVNKASGFTPPTALWFALWDNKPTLSDGTLAWPVADRSKQYAGNVNATVKGVTLNVDKDVVGGLVAR